jgi:hypothetical protein
VEPVLSSTACESSSELFLLALLQLLKVDFESSRVCCDGDPISERDQVFVVSQQENHVEISDEYQLRGFLA